MAEVNIHPVGRKKLKKAMLQLMAGRASPSTAGVRERAIAKHLKAIDPEDIDIVADLDEKDPAERAKCFKGGEMKPHDDQPPAIISVSHQEPVLWISDSPFRILDISREGVPPKKVRRLAIRRARYARPPRNPFYREFPRQGRALRGRDGKYRLSTGPAKPNAVGYGYKITFRIEGKVVDPCIVCAP